MVKYIFLTVEYHRIICKRRKSICYIRNLEDGECDNHLHQEFNQPAPNLVWISDFTYIKVNGGDWTLDFNAKVDDIDVLIENSKARLYLNDEKVKRP